MAEVHHERRGDVAILTMDRPVANALAPSLRAELISRIDTANSDPATCAIVLQGSGSVFSSGVDIPEYDAGLQSPWISDLCQHIEDSPKPVVAALHGVALGGGFELALAAHLRVAAKGTRVALPEVTLGLIPGGGATQRVPRLIGAQAALELMISGQAVDVSNPRMKQIIDQITPDHPLEIAVAAARTLAQAGRWRRTCDQTTGLGDPQQYQAAVRSVLGRVQNAASTEADIARCIEAALLLPFKRGMAFERMTFEDRRTAPDARARRFFYAAERRAMIMPEKASGQASAIGDVALLGEGELVIELAIACLDAGLRVALVAKDEATGSANRHRIGSAYDGATARNRMTASERDTRMARVTAAGLAEAIVKADLVLDTGQLPLDEKLGALKDGVVWAMLTGDAAASFDPPDEAAFDGRCVGLRVHRPAHSAKLIEVSVAPGTHPDAVVTVSDLFSRMGRTAIRCTPLPGLVGNNMSAAFYEAALVLAEAGADPYKVDAAARSLGFGAGPFQMIDREGLPYLANWLKRRAGLRDQTLATGNRIASPAYSKWRQRPCCALWVLCL